MMTNKFMAKLTHKMSAILTLAITIVLLAASIIVSVLCGVNYGAGIKDGKTVTVSVNSFVYNNHLETLENTCEQVFTAKGVEATYVYHSQMSGDNDELVFVFDSETKTDTLESVKTALTAKLNEAASGTGALNGAIVNVAANSEAVMTKIASSRLWRAAIAVGVFAVLAFIYTAIRFRVGMGFVAMLAPIVSTALSTAVVLLVRIPVTNATFYAVLVSAFIASVFVMMLLGKIAANKKADEFANADADELIQGSLATKWIGWTTVALGVALILVGAIATTAVRYFAIASLIGVLVAAFTGLVFAPSACLTVQSYLNDKAAGKTASGYVGAKKENADQE